MAFATLPHIKDQDTPRKILPSLPVSTHPTRKIAAAAVEAAPAVHVAANPPLSLDRNISDLASVEPARTSIPTRTKISTPSTTAKRILV